VQCSLWILIRAASLGESFREKMKEYLKLKLRKGVPSLFMDIKPLYADASKVATIEQLLSSFEKNMVEQSKLEADGAVESPAVLLWIYFMYAQHYDAQGNTQAALEKIDLAIQHTPTLIELYLFKGRIYKVQCLGISTTHDVSTACG
jgi:hypothetical protein